MAALVALSAWAVGCDEPSFRLEMQIGVDQAWGLEVHYEVDGEAAAFRWDHTYPSIDRACRELDKAPLEVQCLTRDDASCGVAEVDGVCCWARAILDSPIVKGRVSVFFDADGHAEIRDVECWAEDGSSTHPDGPVPDAGP